LIAAPQQERSRFARPGCVVVTLLGLWLLTTSARAADATYVVQPRDTLYGVAKKNGLSIQELADRNQLPADAKLYVGQRLKIPAAPGASRRPAATAPAPGTLPESIRDAINSAPVRRGRWHSIVVHHSGVNEGTLAGTERYHREVRRMENGMAYHFLIGNGNGLGDGQIAVGNRWKKQLDGGHLASARQNQTAIGICLVGNFDKTKPTPKQMQALEALTRALLQRVKLTVTAVKTHQQINVVHTRCPGTKFPAATFIANLKKPAR
jgi:LysM repeat protein